MPTPPQSLSISRRELARVNRVLRSEFASGILVIAAAIVGLIAANSPLADGYFALRDFQIGPASLHLDLSLGTWASDGLLAVFFFIVGLELKRELIHGSLRSLRIAIIPVCAALGGVAVPAIIYLAITAGSGSSSGWAIPTATDIAFAIAVLGLIAPRIPPMLRVLLLTLAVVDDFIAIAIIAIFYGTGVQFFWLALAAIPLTIFALLARLLAPWFAQHRLATIAMLLPFAVATWALIHSSGIHATVAGVLLASVIPVGQKHAATPARRVDLAEILSFRMGPFTNGIAVPVFAFFASGVAIGGVSSFPGDPIALGVMVGLVLGKPIGIVTTTLLVTKITRSDLGASIREITGIGCLAGIGFTVALLISQLSFSDHGDVDTARLAVMVGSVIAAACAAALLIRPRPRNVARRTENA